VGHQQDRPRGAVLAAKGRDDVDAGGGRAEGFDVGRRESRGGEPLRHRLRCRRDAAAGRRRVDFDQLAEDLAVLLIDRG
jgi:hypothetical protein